MQAKKALSLASLVAAIPAGVMTYFLVMVFINYADKMSTVLLVAAGLTLLCSAVLLFIPVAALVFGGRKSRKKSGAIDEGEDESTASADESEEPLVEDVVEGESAELDAEDALDETMELDEDLTAESEDFDDFETFDDLDDLDEEK